MPSAVGAGPIPADDGNFKTTPQPRCDRVRGAVGQQVDQGTGGHVDDDGRRRRGPDGGRSRRCPGRGPRRGAGRESPARFATRCGGRRRRKSRSASRTSARPATVSPIAAIIAAAAGVRRLHGSVSPGSCSAKFFVAQSMMSQKKRRTRMSIRTGYPPITLATEGHYETAFCRSVGFKLQRMPPQAGSEGRARTGAESASERLAPHSRSRRCLRQLA